MLDQNNLTIHCRDYLNHFIKNPHSLIVKVLGAYKIQIDKNKPVHFVVLQSVFYPDTVLSARYDIKGCLAGRYQRPGHLSPQSEVYKDQNFVKDDLKLGPDKPWFMRQVVVQVLIQKVVNHSCIGGERHSLPEVSQNC